MRRELEAGVPVDARDPETDLTPLAEAVASPNDTNDVLKLLLALGADPNAKGGTKRKKSVLLLAVKRWDPTRLRTLVEAGADIAGKCESGYDVLISCFYVQGAAHDPRLLETVQFLIDSGAPLDGASRHGETALAAASRLGRLDAIDRLLRAGADPAPLRWTPLHRAVAIGALDEVKKLASGGDLEARDRWNRTPWLLTAVAGDVAKARLLASCNADQAAHDRFDKNAVCYAIERGHEDFLAWLIDQSCQRLSAEQLVAALRLAASEGQAGLVRRLLAAGADPLATDEKGHTPMRSAATLEMRRILEEAGADPDDIGSSIRPALTRLEPRPLTCAQVDFERGRDRRFGRSNPERMDVPFWRAMVAARAHAWAARRLFSPQEKPTSPVWCYSRYGQSITELEDGRVVEVGGEHEDFYDPDFCIYNDVVVHDGHGNFTIYGYPKEVFPPTDFHSATPFEGWIYLIGSLGYAGERDHGRAQVLRISTGDFHIERVETSGDDPGWISRHVAQLRPSAAVLVSRGKVSKRQNDGLPRSYIFDLRTHRWTAAE